MKHEITLIDLEKNKNNKDIRAFVATIDGIHVTGTILCMTSYTRTGTEAVWVSYKFKFNTPGISKHIDYKEIRRELLKQMLSNNDYMAQNAIR